MWDQTYFNLKPLTVQSLHWRLVSEDIRVSGLDFFISAIHINCGCETEASFPLRNESFRWIPSNQMTHVCQQGNYFNVLYIYIPSPLQVVFETCLQKQYSRRETNRSHHMNSLLKCNHYYEYYHWDPSDYHNIKYTIVTLRNTNQYLQCCT